MGSRFRRQSAYGSSLALWSIGVIALLLAMCIVGARLYISSIGSASLAQQLEEICPSSTGLALPLPPGRAEAEQIIQSIAHGLQFVQPPRNGVIARVPIRSGDGLRGELTLVHLDGVERSVVPQLPTLSVAEIALSATTMRRLDVSVGDKVLPFDGLPLTVAREFKDIPIVPVPDSWCGLSDLVEPTPLGDPPPLLAIGSAETVALFNGLRYSEYQLTDRPLTLSQGRDAEQRFDDAVGQWNSRYALDFGELEAGQLGVLINRSDMVKTTVYRTLMPSLLAAVVALLVVLFAAAAQLERLLHRELHLYIVRGITVWQVAFSVLPVVVVPFAAGTGAGVAAAFALLQLGGPSPAIEPLSRVEGVAAATTVGAFGCCFVAIVVACLADRKVDRYRHRSRVAMWLALAVTLLVLSTAISLHRLKRDGGVRTFGVESRGGALLPMSFPLLALLAGATTLAVGVYLALPRLRSTGGGLSRALRLGWRRVVLDALPLASILMAVALAAGCLTTARALADASQRQLLEKATLFVGADLAIPLFDRPQVPRDWSDRTTVLLSVGARVSGVSAEVVGVDPSSFASVADLPDGAGSHSLPELIAQLQTSADDLVPTAIAVGSRARAGDLVALSFRGVPEAVVVRVAATTEFFPGSSKTTAQYVVLSTELRRIVRNPASTLLIRDPPPDAVSQLRDLGMRIGRPRDPLTTFDGSAYSALRWSYYPFHLLGVLFGAVAIALQLLAASGRSEVRRTSYVIMRRTGYTARMLWVASLMEVGVPVAFGTGVGLFISIRTSAIAIPLLDPMPTLPPPARFIVSWSVVGGLVLAELLWVNLVALWITLITVRSDAMETLSGAI